MCFQGNYFGAVCGLAILIAQLIVLFRADETRRFLRADRRTIGRVIVWALVLTLPIMGVVRVMTDWTVESDARLVCMPRPVFVGMCFLVALGMSVVAAGARVIHLEGGGSLFARERFKVAGIMMCILFPTAFALKFLLHDFR